MAMFKIYALDEHTKSLPTVDTASGSIASFNTDLTENLVEVKCQIVAQQASGTPSPSDPKAITTYTEMNVVQMSDITNKSFFDGLLNGTYGFVDLGTLTWQYSETYKWFNPSNASFPIANVKKPATDSTKANIVTTKYPVTTRNILAGDLTLNELCCVNTAGYFIVRDLSYTDANIFKTAMNGVYLIYELTTPTTPTITKTQFETLLSAFSINGSLYNIPFGQTVANGVLDITTGKLRVTHEILTLDGTESVSITGTETNRRFRFNNTFTYNAIPLSSHFIEIDSNTSPWGYYRFISGYLLLLDVDSQMSDETALKTWLANQYSGGTPVQFLCELATPIEIQLDSITLQALLNENNIWCDTGDTEVKYLLTVGKKIS